MQAERNYLTKHVFPRLRMLCESRGVMWSEIDLRWGITDEQSAEGQVLPICLAEIERSRPFFIGLLGERYGWIPASVDATLLHRQPWLTEHQERSITELEIVHGVLNSPEKASHAFFYFRDPAAPGGLSRREQEAFREVPSDDDISAFGIEAATQRAERRQARLNDLKDRIRRSGLPCREGFRDAAELGGLVWEDLSAAIDELFPTTPRSGALVREQFAHQRLVSRHLDSHVVSEELWRHLEAHAQGDGPPLVVAGAEGAGKSALLANWAHRLRLAPTQGMAVVTHFVGATPHSQEPLRLVAHLRAQLHGFSIGGLQVFGPDGRQLDTSDLARGDSPRDPLITESTEVMLRMLAGSPADALRDAMAAAFRDASTKTRLIVILDGLDQLEDRDGSLDLNWLPTDIPAAVRLVISTRAGRPLEEAGRRGWKTLEIPSLRPEDRRQLLLQTLTRQGRSLPRDQLALIANAAQTASPQFLRVLLEELRVHGDHSTLASRLTLALNAANTAELYALVLDRLERDYDVRAKGLVRAMTSLLWATRQGLSDAELADILSPSGQPLPRALLSPLFLALEPYLTDRQGRIAIGQGALRRAVERKFLGEDSARINTHLHIATYFRSRDFGRTNADEVAWQLSRAGAWQQLVDCLKDLVFLERLRADDAEAPRKYWTWVEGRTALRAVDAYAAILRDPSGVPDDHLETLWVLLRSLGNGNGALALLRELERRGDSLGDANAAARTLHNRGNVLKDSGDLPGAHACWERAAQLFQQRGNERDLLRTLGARGAAHLDVGDLEAAGRLLREEERLARKLDDKNGLEHAVYHQAIVRKAQGHLDEAMELLAESMALSRELGQKDSLRRALKLQSLVLFDQGDLDGTLRINRECEAMSREEGDAQGLSAALINQALVHSQRGELDRAWPLLKEAEDIDRRLGDVHGLHVGLSNQASILRQRGNLAGSLALYEEVERVCREHGYNEALAGAVGNKAIVLYDLGRRDGCLAAFEECIRLCRSVRQDRLLALWLGKFSQALTADGDSEARAAILAEYADLNRAQRNLPGLAEALHGLAMIRYSQRRLPEARSLVDEEERCCRELGDPGRLISCLHSRVLILMELGDQQGALATLQEQEALLRAGPDRTGLATCLALEAGVLARTGSYQRALPLLEAALVIAEELGIQPLATHLAEALPDMQARAQAEAGAARLAELERTERTDWKTWSADRREAHLRELLGLPVPLTRLKRRRWWVALARVHLLTNDISGTLAALDQAEREPHAKQGDPLAEEIRLIREESASVTTRLRSWFGKSRR